MTNKILGIIMAVFAVFWILIGIFDSNPSHISWFCACLVCALSFCESAIKYFTKS